MLDEETQARLRIMLERLAVDCFHDLRLGLLSEFEFMVVLMVHGEGDAQMAFKSFWGKAQMIDIVQRILARWEMPNGYVASLEDFSAKRACRAIHLKQVRDRLHEILPDGLGFVIIAGEAGSYLSNHARETMKKELPKFVEFWRTDMEKEKSSAEGKDAADHVHVRGRGMESSN